MRASDCRSGRGRKSLVTSTMPSGVARKEGPVGWLASWSYVGLGSPGSQHVLLEQPSPAGSGVASVRTYVTVWGATIARYRQALRLDKKSLRSGSGMLAVCWRSRPSLSMGLMICKAPAWPTNTMD